MSIYCFDKNYNIMHVSKIKYTDGAKRKTWEGEDIRGWGRRREDIGGEKTSTEGRFWGGRGGGGGRGA